MLKVKDKPRKILKSYRLNQDLVERLESLQHVYGYVGERDASAFMNEFLEEALAHAESGKKKAR